MPFVYSRTIHFPDTDAAGVVFFPSYLAICHEAYEESLAAAGVPLKTFFSEASGTVMPISRSQADYLRPLFVGDQITVTVSPTRLDDSRFGIDYEMAKRGTRSKVVARVRTEHVCITTTTRERAPLSSEILRWIDLTHGSGDYRSQESGVKEPDPKRE